MVVVLLDVNATVAAGFEGRIAVDLWFCPAGRVSVENTLEDFLTRAGSNAIGMLGDETIVGKACGDALIERHIWVHRAPVTQGEAIDGELLEEALIAPNASFAVS
jgi:hypothetical protein